VLRDADKKGLLQIASDARGLAGRARENALTVDEVTGGTFTITNLGMYDVDGFTPVINLPEAAILGVGRIVDKAIVKQDEIVIRKMMVLSLVFDHRLVDGAPAAKFLQFIKDMIETPDENIFTH